MATYCEYTTVTEVRSRYMAATETAQDALLLDIIRATSRDIDAIGCRTYFPRHETRDYDAPAVNLFLDDDLLEVVTLTNGQDGALTNEEYKLYPLNENAKDSVKLLPSSGVSWSGDSNGDREGAVKIDGIWGFHTRYSSAWIDTDATITTSVSAAATTAAVTTGKVNAGDLLRIGSEFAYVSAVAVSTADVLTLKRGVNGSTAALHVTGSELERWTYEEIAHLCATAAYAYYRLRVNPVGDTVQVGDMSFTTPKDIRAYITRGLGQLEVIRENFG